MSVKRIPQRRVMRNGKHLTVFSVITSSTAPSATTATVTARSTTPRKLLFVEHQNIPFRTKPYEVDNTNPFYRYDPDQCISLRPLR